MLHSKIRYVVAIILLLMCGVHSVAQAIQEDRSRISRANSEPENWLSHGRTYDEQRYNPLNKINKENIKQLGLLWSYEFPTSRGKEATPLMVDGTIYLTGSWSVVYAFDAKTGRLLWTYDPSVPRELAGTFCCDVVNRGVAFWQGKIFVGTLDGRLVALEAATGKRLWSVNTVPEGKSYSISGAPRVVKGKVIIGNGGAEMSVRGFVSAYDVDTGERLWRFYTIPGNPAQGFEAPELKMAAKTWSGEWWKFGGGGTAWDSFAYDSKHDLLYIGVGNGSPWSHIQRSNGKGDNLFLSSIVAVRPDTGEYVWHYQTTPKDSWDYTATQHMILADMVIDGESREVIMQAPKNGFFYVIDRLTGKLISAEKYTTVTWASHVDLKTGRPVENPDMHYGSEQAKVIFPSALGGHNWQPMSYSPDSGLVYIPAHNIPGVYRQDTEFGVRKSYWQNGTAWVESSLPEDPKSISDANEIIYGELVAWDPVAQQAKWKVKFPNVWNGGILSTAGGLVFQGNAEGVFVAYEDSTGEVLWEFNSESGIIASPISYSLDGVQYVAVISGWSASYGSAAGTLATRSRGFGKVNRLLVFALGGTAELPPEVNQLKSVDPVVLTYPVDEEKAAKGKSHYMHNCYFCHGDNVVSSSSIPDLRYLSAGKHEIFSKILLDGLFQSAGMPSFKGRLTEEEAELIRQYIVRKTIMSFGSKDKVSTP